MFESRKRHHHSRAPLALTPGRDQAEGASAWELRGYAVGRALVCCAQIEGQRTITANPDTRLPFVSIKHGWQTVIKEANLPGLRLHDLRHSAASNMCNSGVDLFAVGKVLGHASYQSTQRYAHLANDTLLKAVEAGAAKQAAF